MATIDFKIKNIRSADGTTATMAELDGSMESIGQHLVADGFVADVGLAHPSR